MTIRLRTYERFGPFGVMVLGKMNPKGSMLRERPMTYVTLMDFDRLLPPFVNSLSMDPQVLLGPEPSLTDLMGSIDLVRPTNRPRSIELVLPSTQ